VFAHAYAEHLAEHGWIFVAPGHVGDSTLDRLAGTEIDRIDSLVLRAADVSASLDWMETTADDNGFAGAVDSSDALMVGHSRGGTTALMIAGAGLDVEALASACEEDCAAFDDPAVVAALESSVDRRFAAFVTQAPAGVPDFAAGELAGIEAPVMLMTGDLDMTTPDAERAWDLLDGFDDVWIRLPRGAHLSFLSICEDLDLVLEFFLPSAVTDGCGPEFVRAEDAVDVLRGYVLAYGLRHALGDEAWDVALQPPSLDDNMEITAR
jgi:predicted dienelactone hydrolase